MYREKAPRKTKGVFIRRSTETMYQGEPDVCYDICYKKDRKLLWEKVGWKSEGYSEKLAEDIRSERIRTMRHSEELPQEKAAVPTFGDVSTRYLEWSLHNKKSYVQDENRYRLHLKDRFEKKRMNEISTFDLERLKMDLQKKEYAPQTARLILRLIGSIYTKAREWGLYVGDSPVKAVKMPKVQNERTRYLTAEEAHLLLDELKKNPWTKDHEELKAPVLHDIVLVSLLTGARAGEVFGLTGRDVNLPEGIVSFTDTKNGTSRHVPAPDTLQEIFRARMPTNPSNHIFTSKTGGKIKAISNAFDRAVERLGFNKGASSRDRVTFHTLRHTWISWAVLSGTPLRTVMDLSGHKSLAMLQRYSHLSGEDRRRATGAVEGIFKSATENVVSISTVKEEK